MSPFDADAFDAFEEAGWAAKDPAAYDALAGRVAARFAEPLLDAVGAGPGTRLVDVATGPGHLAAAAAARGAEVVAGDATDLPFPDAYVAAFLLLHLGRPERAAAEAARVLRPGGRAALSAWDEPSRGRWLGVLFDALREVDTVPDDLPPSPPIFRFADDGELRALLEGAGLYDVAVETHVFDLELAGADELWDGLVGGTVRTGPLVRRQPEETQLRVCARFDELLEEHRAGDGYAVSVSVKIGVGTRP